MDVATDGNMNNVMKDHQADTNHVHSHGSMHEYTTIREQGEAMPRGMMGKDHMMAGMADMQNTFSLKTCSDFLIEGVKISSVNGIALAMLFTFAVTILLDTLKYATHVLGTHQGGQNKQQLEKQKRKQKVRLLVAAMSHMLSVSLAYIMMLCVMTMNVWLMVSVILGSGIAHFVIRPFLSWKLKRLTEFSEDLNMKENALETEHLTHLYDAPENRKCSENSNKFSLLENSS